MDKDEQKLKKLQDLLELADKDTVSPDEVAEILAILLDLIDKTKQESEQSLSRLETEWYKELQSYYQKCEQNLSREVLSLNKSISLSSEAMKGLFAELKTSIANRLDAITFQQGEKGDKGDTGTPGKDGSPDTPDQVVDKIIASNKKLPQEKIDGLDKELKRLGDVERIAKAAGEKTYTGITETRVNEKLVPYVIGVGTKTLTVSDTAPSNPIFGDLWYDLSA